VEQDRGKPVSGIGADLAGKTALVTGGGTGIGLAIARTLAAHGVRLAIADLNLPSAEAAARSLGDGHAAAPRPWANWASSTSSSRTPAFPR
jgi:NAD(P)-dependent dehydrogenase (short-subunit alcohol dehydrogenase family)